jgi:hypothetical protein
LGYEGNPGGFGKALREAEPPFFVLPYKALSVTIERHKDAPNDNRMDTYTDTRAPGGKADLASVEELHMAHGAWVSAPIPLPALPLEAVEEPTMIEPPSLMHFRVADHPTGFIRFENPEMFHPGLKGYLLESFGVLLPVRVHRSQYPCLSIFRDDKNWKETNLQATFIILTICVFLPGSPVIGWIDWRPQSQESTVRNADFASSDGRDEEKVQTCLRIVRRGFRPGGQRGRPKRSRYFQSEADFRETMVPLIRQCLAEGEEPTQACIAQYLVRMPRFAPKTATQWLRHTDSTARLIRAYCQAFGISWAELVRLAQTPE